MQTSKLDRGVYIVLAMLIQIIIDIMVIIHAFRRIIHTIDAAAGQQYAKDMFS